MDYKNIKIDGIANPFIKDDSFELVAREVFISLPEKRHTNDLIIEFDATNLLIRIKFKKKFYNWTRDAFILYRKRNFNTYKQWDNTG